MLVDCWSAWRGWAREGGLNWGEVWRQVCSKATFGKFVARTTVFGESGNLVLGFAIFGNLVQRFPNRGKSQFKIAEIGKFV